MGVSTIEDRRLQLLGRQMVYPEEGYGHRVLFMTAGMICLLMADTVTLLFSFALLFGMLCRR
jgi:hypothetical protein